MNSYEINNNTIALIYDNERTMVIEKDNTFIVNKLPNEIIKYSCEYFGSSFNGRVEGTKYLTGITHKSPIIIEESLEIIFFPLESPRLKSCSWVRSKYVIDYKKKNNKADIHLINGECISLNCSYETINNQILRSSRLESVIRYRKSQNFV